MDHVPVGDPGEDAKRAFVVELALLAGFIALATPWTSWAWILARLPREGAVAGGRRHTGG